MKSRWIDRTVIGAVAAVTTVFAGCGDSTADRAGGEQENESLVLTFSNPFSDDAFPYQAATYAEQVERLTGGTVTFELTGNRRRGDVEFERKLLEDVRNGTIDMAVVGARMFDTLGVDSFQPLLAPMLIDSYELEEAVFEAGIPRQMLESLDELDVVGAAVLPGPLLRMLAIADPIVAADDFAGQVVAYVSSKQDAAAYTALGATPKLWPPGAPATDFDALAMQYGSIWGNHYELEADAVTTNLIMWPRPMVVIVNPDVYDSLDDSQQAALSDAATGALESMIRATRDDDREPLTGLCSSGLTFAAATDDQLAGIRTALEPVYTDIAEDAQAGEHLEAITRLKEQLATPPDGTTCEQPVAPAATTQSPKEPLEGRWTTGVIPIDQIEATLLRAGIPRDAVDEWSAEVGAPTEFTFELEFQGQDFRHYVSTPQMARSVAESGTYAYGDDQLKLIVHQEGDSYRMAAELSDDHLQLRFLDFTEHGTPEDKAKHAVYTIALYTSGPFLRQP
jgi:TRAP-type C4-dicarboxylate transport system substrate-binding protein